MSQEKTGSSTKGQRLLRAMSGVLARHDFPELGQRPEDHEIEALSVLSRFNEMHVGMFDGEERDTVAKAAVTVALDHWHGAKRFQNAHVNILTIELLGAYLAEPAE